jgi:ribosomal-protein-serine acetyltransferase
VIAIRKYRIEDAPGLYDAICESINELTPWGFFHPGFSLQEAWKEVADRIEWWERGENFSFLIIEPLSGMILGWCGITEIEYDKNQAALGWWVRTSCTCRGVATAAARLAAQAAFEDLGFPSLLIYTRVENTASRRVAEKLGAKLAQVRTESDGVLCAVYQLSNEP